MPRRHDGVRLSFWKLHHNLTGDVARPLTARDMASVTGIVAGGDPLRGHLGPGSLWQDPSNCQPDGYSSLSRALQADDQEKKKKKKQNSKT
jgi:hypothetical protein